MIDFNAGPNHLYRQTCNMVFVSCGLKKVRFLTKAKKVGHAGTLDPLGYRFTLSSAQGKHTKIINTYQGQEKEYTGKFKLGVTTASYDAEQPEENPLSFDQITLEGVETCIQEHFVGSILQKPPIFSAVKVGGERAYSKARKGEDVVIQPKEVTIHSFEITSFEPPHIGFKIVCGKGTYIRSIARDLGEALGCGAYMSELRRTRIGEFKIEDAYSIETFEEMVKALK